MSERHPPATPIELSRDERRFFRDQLREARARALMDAEGFLPIVAAVERLGSMLNPAGKNLGQYKEPLLAIAHRACVSSINADGRSYFTPPEILFAAVKNGRNDAVHQGAFARHLVRHCIELALLLEEGLMTDSKCVADFMVRDATCAEPWHPVALARQRMLAHSFSHLPLWMNGHWKLVSDHAVASFLVTAAKPHDALQERIGLASERGALVLLDAAVVHPTATIPQAIEVSGGGPVLVVQDDRLLGIATPFDFL